MVEYLQRYKEQWKIYDWAKLKELLFRLIVKELVSIENQKGARKYADKIKAYSQSDVTISLEKTTISEETKSPVKQKGLSAHL
jgi:hypothetical protein